MQQLTAEGQQRVEELAKRSGFSTDAVTQMLIAVQNGNGTMAQFNHPEFGGSGQWMRGGMLMLGDMFNSALKGRVDALCNELSDLVANQPGVLRSGSFQSQSQGGATSQTQTSGASAGQSSLFKPDPSANWWPSDLGSPNATGSQNDMRYAYFGAARRLAVQSGGEVWVYDTLDHQIGGFSQQQGGGTSITFTSQLGTVNLSSLPVISRNGQAVQAAPASPAQPAAAATANPSAEAEIFAAIERLGELKAKGLLTEEEFAAKKAELLGRL